MSVLALASRVAHDGEQWLRVPATRVCVCSRIKGDNGVWACTPEHMLQVRLYA